MRRMSSHCRGVCDEYWRRKLVARFDHSEGYKLFSLMRASLVVKCQ